MHTIFTTSTISFKKLAVALGMTLMAGAVLAAPDGAARATRAAVLDDLQQHSASPLAGGTSGYAVQRADGGVQLEERRGQQSQVLEELQAHSASPLAGSGVTDLGVNAMAGNAAQLADLSVLKALQEHSASPLAGGVPGMTVGGAGAGRQGWRVARQNGE